MTDPTVTLEYGESSTNVGLELTVASPTIETSFRIEADDPANEHTPTQADDDVTSDTSTDTESTPGTKRVELLDGRAVVLVPVRFSNRHEDRSLYIAAPHFVLVGSELEVTETRHISHPDVDRAIAPEDLTRFSDLFWRWTTHGTEIEPNETVDDVAVFEVPDDTTRDEFDIVFNPSLNGVGNEYFEPKTAAWTQ